MKTEKELLDIAHAIGSVLAEKNCNAADVLVIIHMIQSDVYKQMHKAKDEKEEGHKVKIE